VSLLIGLPLTFFACMKIFSDEAQEGKRNQEMERLLIAEGKSEEEIRERLRQVFKKDKSPRQLQREEKEKKQL
jgi:hypothetical protein